MRTYGFEKRKRPKLLDGGDGVVPIIIGSKGKKLWGGGDWWRSERTQLFPQSLKVSKKQRDLLWLIPTMRILKTRMAL
jgi:hypothetical protein